MMLKYLIEKEFKQFIRNPFLSKMVIAFPIAIIAILPFVITMDVKNVNVCVVDADQTSLSKRLTGKISASTYFILTNTATTYDAGLAYIKNGQTDIVLNLPKGFEKKLLSGQGADVLIAANATNSTKGSLGGSYLTSIVNEFTNEIANEQGITAAVPKVEVLNLFNRQMKYRTFMLPALMGMLIILLGCAIPALAIVTEKENGTLEQINVTPVGRMQFIIAKLIPYIVMGIVALSLAFLFAWLIYDFVPIGSFVTIYAASLLMIIAMAGAGIVISNYSETLQQAIFLMFFVMIIAILMSGLYTPTTSMPQWARILSNLLPPKHFMSIMRSVYLKGSWFADLWQEFAALCGFVVFFCVWAILSYRKQN